MAVGVTTRYTLVPDGSGTTVRIDGTFTGATVSLMAARLTESATAALQQSLRPPDALLTCATPPRRTARRRPAPCRGPPRGAPGTAAPGGPRPRRPGS